MNNTNSSIGTFIIIIVAVVIAAVFVLWKTGVIVPGSIQEKKEARERVTTEPPGTIDTQGKGISSKELFEPLNPIGDVPSDQEIQDFVSLIDSQGIVANSMEIARECVLFPAVAKIEEGWSFTFQNTDSLEHSIGVDLEEPFMIPPQEEKTVDVFAKKETIYRIYCDVSDAVAGYVWVSPKGFFSENTNTSSQ